MRSRVITIRIVALIVLMTSAADYAAFDRWDPSAPMNSAGLEAIPDLVPETATSLSVRATYLPDDHCLCCSPWIAPQLPALQPASLSSSVTQTAKASLQSSDPILFERPPRA